MMKPRLFSGIQPSGKLNIGGYLGAMKNWLSLQSEYECYFCLVDLHTITVRQDPVLFHEQCYDLLALYLACGLDPHTCTLFMQSHVPEHTQMAWLLSCFTHMGELSRMTQFKDKSQKQTGHVNVGLFTYPILMAADILLYNASLVPVGDDQQQHLELARDIAQRFNHYYGDLFTLPKPYIPKLGSRIMALQNPGQKMSKSDPVANNAIHLLDPPASIRKKIMRAATDSGSEIRYDSDKPGLCNLLTLFATVTEQSIASIESQYQGKGYGVFKADLADQLVALLAPIQTAYQSLRGDEAYLNTLLIAGAQKAQAQTKPMLHRVQKALGFTASA